MNKITIKGGYVRTKIEEIHDYNKNVNRVESIHKAKKGKESYKRKDKHKMKPHNGI